MVSRRTLLIGGAAAAALPFARPGEASGGHTPYFARMNATLRGNGIDRPVLVIDLDRLDRNIDRVVKSARAGTPRNYRIVVKSVPSPALVDYIARRAGTDAGMVFHRPFIEEMARLRPQSDLLLGKPMPVAAVATFYERPRAPFDPARQLQWLVDSETRLAQYLALAQGRAGHPGGRPEDRHAAGPRRRLRHPGRPPPDPPGAGRLAGPVDALRAGASSPALRLNACVSRCLSTDFISFDQSAGRWFSA